jgi:hypothetical protein
MQKKPFIKFNTFSGWKLLWKSNRRNVPQYNFIYNSLKKIKYQGINLTKDVNDPYKENYKWLKKEIKGDSKRWRDLPYSWIGRINIVKMAMLPKVVYLFNTILIKIQWHSSQTLKINPKVHLEAKKTLKSQGNMEQKEQYWRYHYTQLQTILQIHSN